MLAIAVEDHRHTYKKYNNLDWRQINIRQNVGQNGTECASERHGMWVRTVQNVGQSGTECGSERHGMWVRTATGFRVCHRLALALYQHQRADIRIVIPCAQYWTALPPAVTDRVRGQGLSPA